MILQGPCPRRRAGVKILELCERIPAAYNASHMIDLQSCTNVLEQIAPARFAEAWDNVGLLAGDPAQGITRAMLCIDYTPEVAKESAAKRCDLIVAYHPPIFSPLKRLGPPSLIFDVIRRGVAIYSPHTALDVAPGGTNDMLADAVGIASESRRPLRPLENHRAQYKLVTFVPEGDVERVADALWRVGAGQIGNYAQCSFRTRGEGTFYGSVGTSPSVGQAGQFERAEEIKLEVIVPAARLSAALAALKQFHPYEEPAFDVLQMAPSGATLAEASLGQGRIGPLTSPGARMEIVDQLKRALGLDYVLLAGPADGVARTAACCAGACGDLLDDALRADADLYVTGEMRHHDAIRAAAAGMTVVCLLHSNSERAVLKRLAERLKAALPALECVISEKDRDPFQIQG